MSERNGRRELLEHRAEEVRARLAQRLSLIDERRHRFADVARAATRPPLSFVLLAAAGIAATLFIVQRMRARRTRSRDLSQLLRGPAREKSFLVQGLERAATSLVAGAAQRIGRRGLDRLLAEAPLP